MNEYGHHLPMTRLSATAVKAAGVGRGLSAGSADSTVALTFLKSSG